MALPARKRRNINGPVALGALLVLLIAAVVPSLGLTNSAAEEPISGASVLARYAMLESYCDAGRLLPGVGARGSVIFERCARRDGRFRRVFRNEEHPWFEAKWADAQTYYFYLVMGSTTYSESPLDHYGFDSRYRDREKIFPMFLFEIFPNGSPRDLKELTAYMAAFTANRDLSNDKFTVLERHETTPGGAVISERFWVLNADRSIRKYESLGGTGTRIIEIDSVEFNRPLSEADLRYHAPLLARYSFSNRPWLFASALMILGAILGGAFWTGSFIRGPIEEALRTRKRLWRLQLKSLGWSAAALLALALLSLTERGGHPPAIFAVYVLAIWCAIALGITACFILASYPLELLFRLFAGQRRPL